MPQSKTRSTLAAGLLALAVAALPGIAQAAKVTDALDLNIKLFSDVTHVDGDSDGNATTDDGGFHLKRAYFGAKYKMAENATLNFTLDQNKEEDKVFVKFANLAFAPKFGGTATFGLHATPYAGYDENTQWGYRFVQKSFTDYWGAQTTSDLGMSYANTVLNKQLDYHVGIYNGEGYNKATDGKGMALALRVTANLQDIHVGGFIHKESDRSSDKTYDPSREILFAGWDHGVYHVNAQYLWADDGSNTTTFNGGRGYCLQGRTVVPGYENVQVFARYDNVKKKSGGTQDHLFVAGAAFEVLPGVIISPNYQQMETTGASAATNINAQIYGVNAQVAF